MWTMIGGLCKKQRRAILYGSIRFVQKSLRDSKRVQGSCHRLDVRPSKHCHVTIRATGTIRAHEQPIVAHFQHTERSTPFKSRRYEELQSQQIKRSRAADGRGAEVCPSNRDDTYVNEQPRVRKRAVLTPGLVGRDPVARVDAIHWRRRPMGPQA